MAEVKAKICIRSFSIVNTLSDSHMQDTRMKIPKMIHQTFLSILGCWNQLLLPQDNILLEIVRTWEWNEIIRSHLGNF